jgi:hypothetical protein
MAQSPVVITLTSAQRALIQEASGKRVVKLGIEEVQTGSGWLYAGDGKKSWLLKHSDPESYSAARRKRPRIDARRARFRLRIGESHIHRFGVFAKERIPAQRNVIEYVGELVNPIEAYRRTKGATEIYTFALDEFWRIDGSVGGSGAELINHSCDPNMRWHRSGKRVLCRSVRPIQVGEELTLDYRFSPKAPKVRCRCGSPKCRGTINRIGDGKSNSRSKFRAKTSRTVNR